MRRDPNQRNSTRLVHRSRFFVMLQFVILGNLFLAVSVSKGSGLFHFPQQGLLGTGLLVVSLGMVAAAFIALGQAFQVSPHPKSGSRLIQNGVYGILRHPMYTAAALASMGLFLLWPSPYVGISGLGVIVFYLFKSHHEEQVLTSTYPTYASYRKGTLGVLPLRKG